VKVRGKRGFNRGEGATGAPYYVDLEGLLFALRGRGWYFSISTSKLYNITLFQFKKNKSTCKNKWTIDKKRLT